MIYGYARVSTPTQSIERQKRNILAADANAIIYSDKWTGTTMDRPSFLSLCRKLRTGDTVIFDSVSRMSRNADEGVAEYFKLYEQGVNLVFLNEPMINTQVYSETLNNRISMTGTEVDCILAGVNEYLKVLAEKQIRIAFEQAEKEVTDLHNRTAQGMAAADAGPKITAAKTGMTYEVKKKDRCLDIIRKHSYSFGGGLSDAECMELCKCSRNSFYKYKAELKAQQ